MSKWILESLGNLISYISKGIAPKYVENFGEQTIWVLNQKCNRNGVISFKEARLHDLSQKSVSSERMLREKDILINSTGTGTAGRVAQIETLQTPATVDGHMIILRANSRVDPLYLGYALKQQQKTIEELAEGSTGQTEINRERLCNEILIYHPQSIEEQQKISNVLYVLDKKISLNNRINDNLEQQAQIIYQHLFITTPHHIWKHGTINDLGIVIGGGTPSKSKSEYYTKKGIAWITPKDLSGNKTKFVFHGEHDITELGMKNSNARIMPKGTVLFSSRAPIGYIAIAAGEITTNQGFKSIIPKKDIGTAFIYYFLKNNVALIENMASGSTFKEVSGSIMKKIPAFIPDFELIKKFNKFCDPLFAQQQVLEKQNHDLSALRDKLLSKLISSNN